MSSRKKIESLEEIATKLTGMAPIKDREYQKLSYKITNKHHNCRYEQNRDNYFKSLRRKL